MQDILFYVPRTDYMNRDDYDLFDSILTCIGFLDEGIVEFNEHTFRKYWLGGDVVSNLVGNGFWEPYYPIEQGEKIVIYMQPQDEDVQYFLSAQGIRYVNGVTIDDKPFIQYTIDRNCLPKLAELSKHPIKASKRMVEERAYFKFLTRGHAHGRDWYDWFMAEFEADDHINKLLNDLRQSSLNSGL